MIKDGDLIKLEPKYKLAHKKPIIRKSKESPKFTELAFKNNLKAFELDKNAEKLSKKIQGMEKRN